MAAIVLSIDISRRPEDVFSYVTGPSRLPEWQESVVSVRREGGIASLPLAVGSRTLVSRRVARPELDWHRLNRTGDGKARQGQNE